MKFLLFLAKFTRYLADFSHLYSKFILLKKITTTKSCSGLSFKTQFLYTIVFLCRYLDLVFINFTHTLMIYNTIMKILFIFFQFLIIFFMKFKYHYSYNSTLDKMPIKFLIVPCLVIAFFVKDSSRTIAFAIFDYLYTFSILLECVSILPQLVQIQTTGEAETLTSNYILFLGLYRLFYVLCWIFRYFGNYPISIVSLISGVAQTILYVDFFVLYYKYVFSKLKISIPISFRKYSSTNSNK